MGVPAFLLGAFLGRPAPERFQLSIIGTGLGGQWPAAVCSLPIEGCCTCCTAPSARFQRGLRNYCTTTADCCGHVHSFPLSETYSLVRPLMPRTARAFRALLSSPRLGVAVVS